MALAAVKRQITHAIFDVDGTLLDTENIYTEAANDIFSALPGQPKLTWELKSKLMGQRPIDACHITCDWLQLSITPEELLRRRIEAESRRWPSCNPMPGAERVVRHLHSLGIPLAIATGADLPTLKLKISRHPWFSLFSATVAGDDGRISRGKPHPDIFLLAAREMGVPRGHEPNVLVFEDAPNGVEAALAANMSVVAIPDLQSPSIAAGAFKDAHEMLSSLEKFEPAHWGLSCFP